MQKLWMAYVMLILAVIIMPARPSPQWKTHWSYDGATDGADRWGDLDPEYAVCKTGKQQSPIDIENAEKADLPALRFEYQSGPVRIINNGYTAVRVNYPPGNGNFLIVGDKRYELTQFHFHRPSEEYIHGRPADMVIHLMHRSGDGEVAGVAIPLKAGRSNPTIGQLWQYMPETAGPEHEIPGIEVNPATLVPHDTSYYMYAGSVTAPPCTEGVTWFVVKTSMNISPGQIAAFARLYPHDVRPVQPLNGRVVKESK